MLYRCQYPIISESILPQCYEKQQQLQEIGCNKQTIKKYATLIRQKPKSFTETKFKTYDSQTMIKKRVKSKKKTDGK